MRVLAATTCGTCLSCEDFRAGNLGVGGYALACMQAVKDHLYDRNMPLSCENVELRGFEPLTSCMPYKFSQSPDVAACRSTSSFNRPTSLMVALDRSSLAPRLAPLPDFLCTVPLVGLSRRTESNF